MVNQDDNDKPILWQQDLLIINYLLSTTKTNNQHQPTIYILGAQNICIHWQDNNDHPQALACSPSWKRPSHHFLAIFEAMDSWHLLVRNPLRMMVTPRPGSSNDDDPGLEKNPSFWGGNIPRECVSQFECSDCFFVMACEWIFVWHGFFRMIVKVLAVGSLEGYERCQKIRIIWVSMYESHSCVLVLDIQ